MTRALRPNWWLFALLAASAAWACSNRAYRLGTGERETTDPPVTGGRGGTAPGSAGAGGSITGGTGGSGGSTGGSGGCPSDCAGMSFYPRPTLANVVLAVDTTATPADALRNVELALNDFAQRFTSNWIELRLVVLARQQAPGLCVPAPLGSGICEPQGADSLLPALYHHPSAIIDDANALQIIVEEYPVFSSKLEVTEPSTLIVVTGGDATASPTNDPGTFIQAYTGLAGTEWRMSAYYPFSACQGTRGEGLVYRDVVRRTGGVDADICTESAQTAFERIAGSILDRVLPCTIDIADLGPNPPFNRNLVNMKLRGPEIDRVLPYLLSADGCDGRIGGWYFDDAVSPTLLYLCPESCTLMRSSRRAELEQTFGCPTVGYPGCN
jgi:hypothetical protein